MHTFTLLSHVGSWLTSDSSMSPIQDLIIFHTPGVLEVDLSGSFPAPHSYSRAAQYNSQLGSCGSGGRAGCLPIRRTVHRSLALPAHIQSILGQVGEIRVAPCVRKFLGKVLHGCMCDWVNETCNRKLHYGTTWVPVQLQFKIIPAYQVQVYNKATLTEYQAQDSTYVRMYVSWHTCSMETPQEVYSSISVLILIRAVTGSQKIKCREGVVLLEKADSRILDEL